MYPRIYLAIDNCFASKRWTTPSQWAQVIVDLGVKYVECSADTELDPLYMGKDYLRDWAESVLRVQDETGIIPCSLYSGHGTYSTLGLTHTDARVRRNMIEHWFKPLIEVAGTLGTQLGFFAHCFNEAVLQDLVAYAEYCQILEDGLAELNEYASICNCSQLAIEQMYSPNQVPWTIHGTEQLLQRVYQKSGRPFYFTEDVGHHHKKFIKPTAEIIHHGVQTRNHNLWLGTDIAYEAYDQAIQTGKLTDELLQIILSEVDKMPHLYATEEDSDCYQWLRSLGRYAPIVHLQQTDGFVSGHKPFTADNNNWGRIDGAKILRAIKESYDLPAEKDIAPRVDAIYLTLELFSGTAQNRREILYAYAETVHYWRQFVPEDGLSLDELIYRMDCT